jgi:hypothetical protein
MRSVLKSNEVFHFWANKIQTSGRCSNVFFEKNVIYSYGYHFPIARHMTNVRGESAILFTTRSYSNTTAKHISKTRSAIHSGDNLIFCNNPCENHFRNFSAWEGELNRIIKKLTVSRKPEKYMLEIINVKNSVEKYADFLQISVPKELKKLFLYADSEKSVGLLEKAKEKEKKAKEKKEREALVRIKKFKTFELSECSIYDLGEFVYLRINKNSECIETSKGIKIPFAVAERSYRFIIAYLSNPVILMNFKILHYSVNSITDKEIIAGCHHVKMSEVHEIAKKMKW